MGVSQKLTSEIVAWIVLILVVVVGSIVLLNFKVDSACGSGYVYNATSDACALSTNQSTTLSSGSGAEIISTINTSITGFQEPANWVQIVVIALIGAGIIGLFFVLFKMKKKSY